MLDFLMTHMQLREIAIWSFLDYISLSCDGNGLVMKRVTKVNIKQIS